MSEGKVGYGFESIDAEELDGSPPWPTIVLPEERRAQLVAKLEEYRGRLDPNQDQDLQLMLGSDAMSKAVVLDRLLRDGRVDTRELMAELRDRLGDRYNPFFLVNPIRVINDYCEAGGEHTYDGETGLSKPLGLVLDTQSRE